MAIKTYKDGTPFTGVIGRTTEESSPAWPEPPRPPEGAPNVLFFVLDDVGYGQLSCFGGLVETPVIDSLAANGLRYTNMHTTALCSPVAGLHPHRAQPPLHRAGLDHRDLHRLPRLQRHPALRQGHAQRDAGAEGLQHLLRGQVAPDAPRAHDAGRALRPLAARPRLRALLRLHGRRDQPVVSGADLRQP